MQRHAVERMLPLSVHIGIVGILQGSLLQCKAVAERRHLSHKCYITAAELEAEYPMNAKEGYQGLFETNAGAIKVLCHSQHTLSLQCHWHIMCSSQMKGALYPAYFVTAKSSTHEGQPCIVLTRC